MLTYYKALELVADNAPDISNPGNFIKYMEDTLTLVLDIYQKDEYDEATEFIKDYLGIIDEE